MPSADDPPKEHRRLRFSRFAEEARKQYFRPYQRSFARQYTVTFLPSFSAFLMDHEIAQILALALIGGFVLAYKNLKIREKRMESDALREAKEMELAERTLILHEKETDLEVQKLELEIRLLERKQLDS